MPQNQVASGTCDRHVNPADGVGSLAKGRHLWRPSLGFRCNLVASGLAKNWSGRRDSNPRPSAPKAGTDAFS
jgi:hypothetical protein